MLLACPYCQIDPAGSEHRILSDRVVSFGFYKRKSDLSFQQRFFCRRCKKTFSLGTTHSCARQKKRQLNVPLFELLVSGVSQRRAAWILKINRKTVVRKFIFLGLHCRSFLKAANSLYPPAQEVELDDLETFEHTKLKPLAAFAVVESKTRRILGFNVASMPAKGLLVQKSLKKYGKRKDERKKKRRELLKELQPFIEKEALIKSDEHPHYGLDVKEFFPSCRHQTFKGRKGCVVGQGELKSGGYDPIFTLNHSFAMCRANINRLFRRTWNTTKKPERLELHLALYAIYHNLKIIR